jgi:hypothetical protein
VSVATRRKLWILPVAIAAAVVTLASAAGVAGAAPDRGFRTKTESHIVHTRYGDIYVEVARPVTANGKAVVEWIARRRWSNGKVGMIGGSYEGTTAWATAITRPQHLTTIVPEAAIARWYDYAYSGGIRYSWTDEAAGNEGPGAAADEGLDTPAGFDFGLQMPPPLDPQDPSWADRVASNTMPCHYLANTRHGYDTDTPTYDRFWKRRDYLRRARRIHIPVLIAANWGDWNVKQEESVLMYRALGNAPVRKLFMGTRWSGHGTPGGAYDKTVDAWFAHYLKGAGNGIENLPAVTSQMSDKDEAIGWYRGPWPEIHKVTLYAQKAPRGGGYPWKQLRRNPARRHLRHPDAASFTATSANTESAENQNPRLDRSWFWFESRPLRHDTRIFGSPKVKIYSTVDRPVGDVHARGRRCRPERGAGGRGPAPRPAGRGGRGLGHQGLPRLPLPLRARPHRAGSAGTSLRHDRGREAARLHLPQGPRHRPQRVHGDRRVDRAEALPVRHRLLPVGRAELGRRRRPPHPARRRTLRPEPGRQGAAAWGGGPPSP